MWQNTLDRDPHPRRYKYEQVSTTFFERVRGWLKREGWNRTKNGLPIEVPFGTPEYDEAPLEENIIWSRAFLATLPKPPKEFSAQ